jgi:short-subunit dehydrogenase
VNNAGQGLRSSVETINLDDYRNIMELNVFAVLVAMQEVIPIMRKQGGGTILNVGSMVSKNTFPMIAAYASTKYALNALSLTARQELAQDNIIVSVFHPKMTATDFGKNAHGQKYDSRAGRPACRSTRRKLSPRASWHRSCPATRKRRCRMARDRRNSPFAEARPFNQGDAARIGLSAHSESS